MSTVTPYLVVKGAERAIAFYTAAFGAKEEFRLDDPAGGRIGHAELLIGDARIMIADEYPDFGALSPHTVGGCPVQFHVAVENADAAVARALAAGAVLLRPVVDEFYGERQGTVVDPFGYRWSLAQHKEDVTPQEMQRRWSAMMKPA